MNTLHCLRQCHWPTGQESDRLPQPFLAFRFLILCSVMILDSMGHQYLHSIPALRMIRTMADLRLGKLLCKSLILKEALKPPVSSSHLHGAPAHVGLAPMHVTTRASEPVSGFVIYIGSHWPGAERSRRIAQHRPPRRTLVERC